MRGNGTVVDDPSSLRVLFFHNPESFLGAEKSPCEIDIDHRFPLFDSQVLKRDGRSTDACIVEEQVQSSKLLFCYSEKGLYRSGV